MNGDHLVAISNRQLGIAIRVAAVIAVGLAGYLVYAVVTYSGARQAASPASRAIEALRATVYASPGNPDLRLRLAEAMAYAGDLDGAVEQYRAALTLRENDISALNGLAMIAMSQKNHKAAETYWKKIINLLDKSESPTVSLQLESAYYGLGVTYIDLKRYEEAVVNLKEAARLKMSASDTHYMLSVAYLKLGYPDKQRDELEITLAFDPKNAQAAYDMGLVVLKEGDVPAAAEYLRTAADGAPRGVDGPRLELDKLAKQGSASSRLAKALVLRETDAPAALSEARISAALDPASPEATRLVAELWDETGNAAGAVEAYRKLLQLTPNDPVATEAIKRLSANAK